MERQQAFPELPYHRFSNGDGILVVSTLPNGELPKADPSQASSSALCHFLSIYTSCPPLSIQNNVNPPLK